MLWSGITQVAQFALSLIVGQIPGIGLVYTAAQSLPQLANDALLAVFGALPDGGGLPQGVHDAAIYFGNNLQFVNFILPVPELLSCMILILGTKILLCAFHIIFTIANFVRGIPTAPFDSGGLWYDSGNMRQF